MGGQEVQGKQDNTGYHNELLTSAKIPFASKEVSRKTLKVDKVAFRVAFSVFTGICNTSFGSHHAASLTAVPGTEYPHPDCGRVSVWGKLKRLA